MKLNSKISTVLIIIVLSLRAFAGFGGGNEGGGNVSADGRVFDFAEYEDLEEIKDIRKLEVFKFNPEKNGLTDNTWTKLKEFFDKEFNTAFLAYFLSQADARKWYFDKSGEPFTGSCLNESLSDRQKIAVACQDDKEVRINKKWWYDTSTTDWKRVGILMHEMFLIHARSVYDPLKAKDDGEKAVRAINAKMFRALAIYSEKPFSAEKVLQAKSELRDELSFRDIFFSRMNNMNYYLPGIGFILNESVFLLNGKILKDFYLALLPAWKKAHFDIQSCHLTDWVCFADLRSVFSNSFSVRIDGYGSSNTEGLSQIVERALEVKIPAIFEQYCPAVKKVDQEMYMQINEKGKEIRDEGTSVSTQVLGFSLSDLAFSNKISTVDPKKFLFSFKARETASNEAPFVIDCYTSALQQAISSGEFAKNLNEKLQRMALNKANTMGIRLEKLFKDTGAKRNLP